MARIDFVLNQTPLRKGAALILKKRGGGERRVACGSWWINRNTPVGEDAEIWEHKPYGGRREIRFSEIVALEYEEKP